MNASVIRRMLGAILVVGAISATTSVASAQYYSVAGPRDYMYSGSSLSYQGPYPYASTYYSGPGFYSPYGAHFSPYYSYSTYSQYPTAAYYAPATYRSYYAPSYSGYSTSYAPAYYGRGVGRVRRVW
jgi:hypothetical protein